MPSVFFYQFERLWTAVEKRFVSESDDSFNLENLYKHLISQGILTTQSNLKPIKDNFLDYIGSNDPPPLNVNLSNTIFNALFRYLEIRNISELPVGTVFREVGFIGRKKELIELENFLKSPDERIFALYGVPMIGKTQLVNHFLENNDAVKKYKVITVKLNPKPENPEQKIKDVVFGDKDFKDFSSLQSNTLIVIQNFEAALKVAGDYKALHSIDDEYSNIKTFLGAAANENTVKIIIESRYHIRFDTFLNNWKTKIRFLSNNSQLEGVERNEFWQFYRTKGFSSKKFEELCNKFDDHTWLLARAFNSDDVMLFDNNLLKALGKPSLTTRYLWDYIETIIAQLENQEILILCALTLLREPVKAESLYQDFLSLPDFSSQIQIEEAFVALKQKLLIQSDNNWFYDLNHLLQEVFYTFMENSRKSQMSTVKGLPFIKQHSQEPVYDEIQQAMEKQDWRRLIELAKRFRKEKNFVKAFEAIEAGLPINPKPQNVLNEKALCFREIGEISEAIKIWELLKTKYKHFPAFRELGIYYRENDDVPKSIEILEEALKIENDDDIVKTLTELAISYSENKEYVKSITTANKAIKLGDNYCYIVLANTYERMGEAEKAYEIIRDGIQATNGNDQRLVEKFGALKHLKSMKNVILFLSANPQGSTLRLDQEMRQVENQLLRVAKYRDNFTLNKEVATRITDLQQRLLDETPDFVHFSGHGSESGIYLTDNQGNYQLVKGEALANLFNLFSDKVQCVFLNSCYSEHQATEINKFIPFVIGMKKAVPDNVAIQFAISFYQAIASGREVEFAFEMAKNSVDLHNLSGSEIPILLKKTGRTEEIQKQQQEVKREVKKLNVFLSYSHKDEEIKDELDVQLSGLKRSDKISTWNDRQISPGIEWDSKIKQELDNADIILLLVSANFIASEYIWNVEVKKAIERHEKGEAKVIPIFCRACDFHEMPFAKLQGLPKDAKFINSQPNRDEALAEVAKGIRKVVEDLLK